MKCELFVDASSYLNISWVRLVTPEIGESFDSERPVQVESPHRLLIECTNNKESKDSG